MDAERDREKVGDAWRDLPDDVLMKILAKVPLPSLLRLRAVCKALNKAVLSPLLLKERADLRAGEREWMLFVPGSFVTADGDFCDSSCVYDLASNRWYKLQQSAWIPPPTPAPAPAPAPEPGALRPTWLLDLPHVSAGGGLLMSASFSEKQDDVYPRLGNPVARSWVTSLPALPGGLQMQHVRGVWVDAKARSFKLVAVMDTGERPRVYRPRDKSVLLTFVLDSAIWSWSETSRTMEVPVEESFFLGHGVFVGSVLYCPTGKLCNLLAYDLERASWSYFTVRNPDRFHVFSCNGLLNLRDRLLCVALGVVLGCQDMYQDRRRSFHVQVWELDFARMSWTVVAAIPTSILTDSEVLPPTLSLGVVAGPDQALYLNHRTEYKVVALDLRPTPAAWRSLPSHPYKDQDQDPKKFVSQGLFCLDPWLDFGTWMQVPSGSFSTQKMMVSSVIPIHNYYPRLLGSVRRSYA